MRRGRNSKLFSLAVGLLALSLVAPTALAAQKVQYEKTGPRVDEIIMPIITESEAQLIAFERGETVVLPGLAKPSDIDKVKANRNADLTMNLGFHMFYLAFNMRREPLSELPIRRAIAHVVNRDQIINSLFKGYMLPLNSFVPPSSPYYNEDVPYYEYNPAMAREVLDKAGYVLDKATGIRIDPKTKKPLRKMTIYTPTYEVAPTSAELGKMIAEAARSVGLPVEAQPLDFNVMLSNIDNRDFDMYVLAWGLDRIPTFLYVFFHSSNDVIEGYNTPGIRIPELDAALEQVYYAKNEAMAKKGADDAQRILSREVPYVTLYSRPYIDAWRKDMVTGYVPMMGYGAANYNNKWTTLNIRRVDGPGGTIRWLLPENPESLNPLTTSSAYSWEVLGRIYDGLIEVDPNTMKDIPWLAESWEVGTWSPEKGKTGTKITWHLRKDVKWQDGVPFTSKDVKFTLEYLKENQVPIYQSSWQDLVKVETPDPYTAVVYFSTESYWHLYHANAAFLPEHIWKDVKDYKAFQPWLEPHPTVKGLTKLIGTGPFVFKEWKPGDYVRLVRNPLYFAAAK